jgi:hypothetical protein
MTTNTATRSRTVADLQGLTYLTVPDAGAYIGLGRAASYAAAKRGDLPTVRIGRRVVVPAPMLLRMLGVEQ